MEKIGIHLIILLRARRRSRSRGGRARALAEYAVDLVFVRLEEVAQEGVVEHGRALGHRVHAPDEEGDLDRVEEGDPVENEVHEGLQEAKEAVNNPIYQPLRVVRSVLRLDGLERGVHRVQQTHEVADEIRTQVEEDK